jgi:uncharacterized protein YraI
MKKLTVLASILTIFAATPAMADSVWFVKDTVDLHAGPDTTFPVVASIPAEAHMQLEGCIHTWNWCDVSWNGQRGWVSGDDIQSVYENKPMVVTKIGPTMHVPVVTYDTQTYWDTYYKTAPFYTQRERYVTFTTP